MIGVPDDRLGEVGYALWFPQSGHRPTPPRSSTGVERKWPTTSARHVEIVDSLPLNASNKVLKFELRSGDRCPELKSIRISG